MNLLKNLATKLYLCCIAMPSAGLSFVSVRFLSQKFSVSTTCKLNLVLFGKKELWFSVRWLEQTKTESLSKTKKLFLFLCSFSSKVFRKPQTKENSQLHNSATGCG